MHGLHPQCCVSEQITIVGKNTFAGFSPPESLNYLCFLVEFVHWNPFDFVQVSYQFHALSEQQIGQD